MCFLLLWLLLLFLFLLNYCCFIKVYINILDLCLQYVDVLCVSLCAYLLSMFVYVVYVKQVFMRLLCMFLDIIFIVLCLCGCVCTYLEHVSYVCLFPF